MQMGMWRAGIAPRRSGNCVSMFTRAKGVEAIGAVDNRLCCGVLRSGGGGWKERRQSRRMGSRVER